MRVLLTTPYDLAVPGGVNGQALGLLDALTAAGHPARLVGPASAPVFADDPRIVRLGRVWVGRLNGAHSRVTLDLGLDAAVRRLVADFRPDVVHLQEPFLPTLNSFVLRHAGRARRVGTFHTYSETSRGYLWSWPWCWAINRQLDVRIAVSEAARDFATRYHPADFHVLPNAIALPPPPETRPPRAPGRPARLLFVGRADEPRKGFAVLQAALQQLEATDPGAFVLDAIGRGTPRGEVSAAELSAAWTSADLCVVPSLGGESFGLVALEALAHGVPVVATRIRGYAGWLDGAGVGALVPPGDAPALAAAIRALGSDPAHHAACAARARPLAERFAWPAALARLVSLYT